MKRATHSTETPQVGRSVPRLESWLKVTGRAEYVHNLRLPGMLYGKIFRRRGARVDAPDASVRDRAAEDLAVEHARQPEIVHIFGAAGNLGLPFQSRHRTPDLPAPDRARHHQFAPSAARNARAT